MNDNIEFKLKMLLYLITTIIWTRGPPKMYFHFCLYGTTFRYPIPGDRYRHFAASVSVSSAPCPESSLTLPCNNIHSRFFSPVSQINLRCCSATRALRCIRLPHPGCVRPLHTFLFYVLTLPLPPPPASPSLSPT